MYLQMTLQVLKPKLIHHYIKKQKKLKNQGDHYWKSGTQANTEFPCCEKELNTKKNVLNSVKLLLLGGNNIKKLDVISLPRQKESSVHICSLEIW